MSKFAFRVCGFCCYFSFREHLCCLNWNPRVLIRTISFLNIINNIHNMSSDSTAKMRKKYAFRCVWNVLLRTNAGLICHNDINSLLYNHPKKNYWIQWNCIINVYIRIHSFIKCDDTFIWVMTMIKGMIKHEHYV